MNSGSIFGGLILVGVAGYFGYDWWKGEQEKKKAAAAAEAAKNAPVVVDGGTPTYNPIAMPSLKGMTVEQANEALVKAGFKNKVKVLESYVCEYTNEEDMPTKGTICNQDPAPDAKVTASRKIEVTVEVDTYEEGSVGGPSEWRRMPELVGMTQQAALDRLKAAGFREDEFTLDVQQGACASGIVCWTSPNGKERKVRARLGSLTVGQ